MANEREAATLLFLFLAAVVVVQADKITKSSTTILGQTSDSTVSPSTDNTTPSSPTTTESTTVPSTTQSTDATTETTTPTTQPTAAPTTETSSPTTQPTAAPTTETSSPTTQPTAAPTTETTSPTTQSTTTPTASPTAQPTTTTTTVNPNARCGNGTFSRMSSCKYVCTDRMGRRMRRRFHDEDNGTPCESDSSSPSICQRGYCVEEEDINRCKSTNNYFYRNACAVPCTIYERIGRFRFPRGYINVNKDDGTRCLRREFFRVIDGTCSNGSCV